MTFYILEARRQPLTMTSVNPMDYVGSFETQHVTLGKWSLIMDITTLDWKGLLVACETGFRDQVYDFGPFRLRRVGEMLEVYLPKWPGEIQTTISVDAAIKPLLGLAVIGREWKLPATAAMWRAGM